MKIYNHRKLVTQICMLTQQKRYTELRLLSLSAQHVFLEKENNKTSTSAVQVGKQKFVCHSLKKIVMIAVTLVHNL